MANNNIPHRFRESSFRKYEKAIDSIVTNFPLRTTFRPENTTTFSNRLRDAIKSFGEYQWTSFINSLKFIQIQSEIVVSERRDGTVVVGNRETINDKSPVEGVITGENNITDQLIIQDLHSLSCLCTLLSNRVLRGPYEITWKSELSWPEDLESRFDIAVTHNSDNNTYTII